MSDQNTRNGPTRLILDVGAEGYASLPLMLRAGLLFSEGADLPVGSLCPLDDPRIAIADDEPFAHDAIRRLLDGTRWKHEEHHYYDVAAVVLGAREGKLPHVLFMDVYFPLPGDPNYTPRRDRERTFAAIAAIRYYQPEVQVVVMTARAVAPEHVFDALRAGAVGYVTKNDLHERLFEIIDEVRAGGSPITPDIARHVMASIGRRPASTRSGDPTPPTPPGTLLTDSEEQLLELVRTGHPLAECARALNLTLGRAQCFVRSIYLKLEAFSRSDFVAAATRDAFIPRSLHATARG